MRLVECVYLERNGRRPAEEFINSLDEKTQRKFFSKMGLLETFGHLLPEPHAKYIGDSIFELRFRGIEGHIRVLYFFFHRNRAIFTNGFVKKSKKIPKRNLQIAVKSKNAFLESEKKKG